MDDVQNTEKNSMIKGIVVALLTPMSEDGSSISFPQLESLCDLVITHGADGILVAGTTGEGPLLSIEERQALTREVFQKVNGRIPVLLNVGSITLDNSIALTEYALKIGVNAIVVSSPYYYCLDERSLESFFAEIIQCAQDFPVYLYNIPQCTGNDISPKLAKKLFENHSIKGIKDSSGQLERVPEYCRISEEFDVLIGADSLILPALKLGAKGCISSGAGVFPEIYVKMYRAFENEDLSEAQKYQDLVICSQNILKNGKLLAYYKEALKFRNIYIGAVRKPLRQLEIKEIGVMASDLYTLGLI